MIAGRVTQTTCGTLIVSDARQRGIFRIGVPISPAKSVIVDNPATIRGTVLREDTQRLMVTTMDHMSISSTTPRLKQTSPGNLWETCEVEGDFRIKRGVMLRFSFPLISRRVPLTHMLLVYDRLLHIIPLIIRFMSTGHSLHLCFILTLNTA